MDAQDALRQIEEKARLWIALQKDIHSASKGTLQYFNGKRDAALDILEMLEQATERESESLQRRNDGE